MSKIIAFKDEYKFLSNFYPVDIEYEGITYPTVENAYQAAKTILKKERIKFVKMPPGVAKREGTKVTLRKNWDNIKLSIMEELVYYKFANNEELKDLLLGTGNLIIEEGNYWGDTFWGIYNGRGDNHLGRILMRVRKRLDSYGVK
jgi:ribA/ribD-fused uncharacterized protein